MSVEMNIKIKENESVSIQINFERYIIANKNGNIIFYKVMDYDGSKNKNIPPPPPLHPPQFKKELKPEDDDIKAKYPRMLP